jgi:hypothetical protein
MGLDFKDMLVPSKPPFYGIIPGNVAHPLGMVVLPVTFGTRENYRTEFIKFKVASLESSYHAILGGHSPSLWQCHITFICFSRCQD